MPAAPSPASGPTERRRRFPAGQRIGTRLRWAFSILGITYALAVLISWIALVRVEAGLSEIADYAEPIGAAAYEMEISINGAGMDVMKYLHRSDPALVVRFQNNLEDFDHFFERYGNLVRTLEERALVGRVDELRTRYFDTGRRLLLLRDELSAHYGRFTGTVAAVDKIVAGGPDGGAVEAALQDAPPVADAMKAVSRIWSELAEVGSSFATAAGDRPETDTQPFHSTIKQARGSLAALQDRVGSDDAREATARLSDLLADLAFAVTGIVTANATIGIESEAFVEIRESIDTILNDEIQILARGTIATWQRRAQRNATLALVTLVALGAIVLLITAVSAYRVSDIIVRPLDKLSRAAHALSAGQLSHRVRLDRKDEIGEVAHAFDVMAGKLQDATTGLENQVRARTGELAMANRDLLDELDRRTRVEGELTAARDAAQAADRSKSEFLANMSHELRTPLNAVIGFSEMIGMETFGPIGSARYTQYASDIEKSARHLLGVINDILDLSRVEAGKVTLNEQIVDVAAALNDAFDNIERAAATKEVRLVNGVSGSFPQLKADPMRVHQILLNLVSNAVKFTEAGGRIAVEAVVRADSGIDISVRDTGIGMRWEDIPRALAPFEQIDSRLSRKYEGTGLGLTLARSFVQLHGGELGIESEPGVGTTVTVAFPPERTLAAPHAMVAGSGSR